MNTSFLICKKFHEIGRSLENLRSSKYYALGPYAVTLNKRKKHKKPLIQLIAFISTLFNNDTDFGGTFANKNIAHFISLAEKSIGEGNLIVAETQLNNALEVCDTASAVGIYCVYDMLATLAFRQGDTSKAEKIIKRAISKLTSILPYDDNSIIDFNLKLARLYESKGETNLAEAAFKYCLVIQKRKYDSGKRDDETIKLWVNILYWYGQYLKSLGRHEEASHCFQSAYTLSTNVSDIDSQQLMVMLYNLGEMSFAMGHYDEAIRHLLNAVVLGRAVNSTELNTYYNKIGIIYLHKGVYVEAKKWCENAFKISNRWADKDVKKESAECLNKLKKFFSDSNVPMKISEEKTYANTSNSIF